MGWREVATIAWLDQGVPMRRWVAAYFVGFLLQAISLETKGAVEPPSVPEFTPPLVESPKESSESATPALSSNEPKLVPEPSPNTRPLLILPGMANARGSNKPRPAVSQPLPSVILSTPQPIEPSSENDTSDSPRSGVELHGSLDTPLGLESVPSDESTPPESPKPSRERPSKPASPRSTPMARQSLTPKRSSTYFGRLFPSLGRGRWEDEGDGIRVDAKSDPAADAAMKRRVEKQVRESVGSRLKAFDVRVVGRDIIIRGQALRFWQKRSTRTAIEALPALSGYNVVVEIVD